MLLWITCDRCGKARQALDPAKVPAEQLGLAVRDAAREGLRAALASSPSEFGCECAQPGPAKRRPIWNLRQAMVVVTALCVALAAFRRPLQMLFGVNAWNAAAAPWQFYGWLFWGADLPNKADIGKGPVAIFWLSASMMAAALTGWYVVYFATRLFQFGWRWANRDHASTKR